MITLATGSGASSMLGVMLASKGTKMNNGSGGGTINLIVGLQEPNNNKHHAANGGAFQVKANAPSINSSQVATCLHHDGFVSRQKFSIRSYEVDSTGTASIETLLNYLQESATNHLKMVGIRREGFGSTEEMIKRNLIWVFTQMQVLAYRYPTWGDDVEVEAWMSESGKNAVRWNWLLRDSTTNEALITASSICVMMNKLKRRLSKIPEEARREFEPYFVVNNSAEITEKEDDNNKKLPKLDDNTADYIRTGLNPRWSDLDMNLHVNNAKYIGWVLESVPRLILLNHELCSMRLEYRRECNMDSKLQSLTSVVSRGDNVNSNLGQSGNIVECNHLLRLEDGAEILRGKTEWRPKPINYSRINANLSAL